MAEPAELPQPLVPAEVDLRGLEYMPLLGGKLLSSDFHARASDAEWRAALTLWWAAWQQVPAGSLPDDDVILCRLAELGRDIKTWRRVKAMALHGFAMCSDGRLYHRVLCEQALIAWDKRAESQQKRGAEADRKRRERAERSRMFDDLRVAGVTPPWNTATAELRALVTQHVTRTGPQDEQDRPPDITEPVTRTVTAKTVRYGTVQEIPIPSEPNGSGSAAAPPPAVDAADMVFGLGVPLLTAAGISDRNARSMLGLQRKTHGDMAVIDALQRCATERPLQPVPWLQAALKAKVRPANRQASLEEENRRVAAEWAKQMTEKMEASAHVAR